MTPAHGANDLANKAYIKSLIFQIIHQLDTEKVLTAERLNWLARLHTNLLTTAVLKYIAGQKEHGDHIEDCDLHKEIQSEIIDLVYYLEALTNPL